ncbi:MAG: AMP-binding protein [Rhodospirillaceae bacterium]|nr:AMP-binding protein [Rhodospirillaceae bacterium]
MQSLTDLTEHRDAMAAFSKDRLWELFDGDRDHLNIAHECVDRHPPDRIAVRIAHADGRDEALTFGDLKTGSNRFANYLRNTGVTPGQTIGVMLEPSALFYAALFGAMKAGCVAVPLFTLFGPDGLKLRLDDCDPALFLAGPEHASMAEPKPGRRIVTANDAFLAVLNAESDAFDPVTRADDMAMYQYTSGTTRLLPDAIKHRHRAVVTVMIAALYGTGIRPGDQFMCPSSPAWGHGLWHGTLAPLALGVTTATYSGKFDAARLFDALRDYRITNLSAAATHYRMMRMADNAIKPGSLSIPKLTFTGEPIDSDTAAWAAHMFGAPVRSMYGTTEVGVILVNFPGASDFDARPGSLGKPVPGQRVEVHDIDGAPCPPGQRGEIMLWRNDEWFPTKDLGYTDEDGYFYHAGRADDVIISAGWTMSAVEIEDILLKHPDVREAAVIGSPDEDRGHVPKAFIVSVRPGDDAFTTELQTLAQTRLSRHEYPRLIEYIDELPKLPAGKINRKALRERDRVTYTHVV